MQDRLELEQVIRVEISARMESFKQLKQEAAGQSEIFRGQLLRAERKAEIVLDTQRQVSGKVDILQGELEGLQASTGEQFGALKESIAKDTLATKKRMDRDLETMLDALKSQGDELESTLQVWTTLVALSAERVGMHVLRAAMAGAAMPCVATSRSQMPRCASNFVPGQCFRCKRVASDTGMRRSVSLRGSLPDARNFDRFKLCTAVPDSSQQQDASNCPRAAATAGVLACNLID